MKNGLNKNKIIKNTSIKKTTKRQLKQPGSKHLMIGAVIFVAAVLVISGTNILAFAVDDNLRNDVENTFSNKIVPITSGSTDQTLPVNYWIQAIPAGGGGECDATAASPATVTIISGLPVTGSPMQFTSCGPTKQVTFTIPANSPTGTFSIDATVSDNSGGYNTSPAKFTISVTALDTDEDGVPDRTDNCDDTPNADQADTNGNGIGDACEITPVNNPPTVTLTPPSGVDLTNVEATGPDGASLTFQVSASDPDVGDTTTITCTGATATPSFPIAGPGPTSVTFTFPYTAPGPTTTPISCSATDNHAATSTTPATATVTVKDTTAPEWPANLQLSNIIVKTAQSSVPVTYTTPTGTDLVDVTVTATCIPASGSSFNVGTTGVDCKLTDKSNNQNTETKSFTIQVLQLTVQFPLQPVDEPGPSVFKIGSAIPLKALLGWFDGTTTNAATDVVATISAAKTTAAGTSTPVTEEISTASPTSGTTMRLSDPSTGLHIFNFGTKNIAKSGTYTTLTFTVSISTADAPGSSIYTESVTVGVR